MPIRRRMLFLFFAFIIATAAAGCDQAQPTTGNPPGQTAPAKQPDQTPAETMPITVYYATKDAMHLVAEVHTVAKNDHPARSAVELLLQEPKSADLVRTLPPGVKLRGLTVKDNIAYVDFDNKLIKSGRGGSAGEILLVGAIVNTLTEFPDIHKVQILVEGKKVDTIHGHMDTGEPLGRSEQIIKKSL